MTRRLKKMFSAKHPTKIGTWNVWTLYQSGKSQQVARRNWQIPARNPRAQRSKMDYIRHDNTNHWPYNHLFWELWCQRHTRQSVGFMLTKKAKRSLLEWNPVSVRIIPARFDTKFQKTTIIQVYSPTNDATEDDKNDFYNSLQTTIIPYQNETYSC